MVAEVAVAVTVGMRLPVLDPEQLQRQVPVLPELVVYRREVRQRSRRRWRRQLLCSSEQLQFDPAVIPFFRQRPSKPGDFRPPQVIMDGGLADGTAPGQSGAARGPTRTSNVELL